MIGNRIKLVRDQLGLNQTAFAQRLGLSSPTAISRYEKGQREPDIESLIKITELANITLDWLLTGEGAKEREPLNLKNFTIKESGPSYGSNSLIKKGACLEEEEYVIKLRRIFREKDKDTISAVLQNIDTFLRVPSKPTC